MIYTIDIDDTLSIPRGGHYLKYQPALRAIAKVNQLYEQGHTIKIFTARGARSGIDWLELTEKQLKEWGVKYHELLMTKPDSDIFIDDKAINTRDWLRANRLVMVIGERGAGKSVVVEMLAKRGYSPVQNEDYYLRYGELYPNVVVNQDGGLQDKIYGEVGTEIEARLKKTNVVYEASGGNERWSVLKDRMSWVYPMVIVKVKSLYANERYLRRGVAHNYPSTPEGLAEIKERVNTIKADYEIANDSSLEGLDIQVEGVAQKFHGKKLVAVSGAFDPMHIGHIRYFKKARELGRLVVVMRNDNAILLKKGYVFMPEVERKEVLESVRYVNAVVVAVDKDQTSNRTLELLKPDIYAKGGDKKGRSEAETCRKIGCEIITGIVPTYQSSSKLVNDVCEAIKLKGGQK